MSAKNKKRPYPEGLAKDCEREQAAVQSSLAQAPRSAIGPSSDDYEQWLACQPTLVAAFASGRFTLPDGYQVWRHAWMACEVAHGIRANHD